MVEFYIQKNFQRAMKRVSRSWIEERSLVLAHRQNSRPNLRVGDRYEFD